MSQGVHKVREQLAQHIFAGTKQYHKLLLTGTTKKKLWQVLAAFLVWSARDGWVDESIGGGHTSRFDTAEVRGRGQEWDVRAQLLRQYQTSD